MPKILFVWLEGPSDELFFERALEPHLGRKYEKVFKSSYAERSTDSINKKLHEVTRSHAILDYLWCADLDSEVHPCVTKKKDAAICRHPLLQPDRIMVVAPEIEAWYLAGLDGKACAALGIREFQNTNSVTKEQFKRLLPDMYNSEIDFRMDVLKKFSLDIAQRKNESLAYFCRKHLEIT